MDNKTEKIYNYVINLFKSELKIEADKLEKKRKILSAIYKGLNIILILAIAVPILYLAINSNLWEINIIYILIFAICFIVTSIISLKFIIHNIFASEAKKKLFANIYKALDPKLTYIPGGFKLPVSMYGIEKMMNYMKPNESTSFMFESNIKKMDILPQHDYIRVDDVILGNYQGHEVQIIEFSLIEERIETSSKGHRRRRYIEIFHGALFQTSMEKRVNTRIYIKQKGLNSRMNLNSLEKINLESNEFAKIFDVYSGDQIESRYFLTTAVMDKFLKINKSGLKTSGFIVGNSVNILIHSKEDMFEPDLHKPINNPNSYFDTIFQAKFILDIITELNLDSKTGL